VSRSDSLTQDELAVLLLAEEDAYGFVEIAGTIGDIARAQTAVRSLLAEGLVVVEQRDRWDTGPDRVLSPTDALTAISVPEHWTPNLDPSLPWHQVALSQYE
jgi:hypothetical protein